MKSTLRPLDFLHIFFSSIFLWKFLFFFYFDRKTKRTEKFNRSFRLSPFLSNDFVFTRRIVAEFIIDVDERLKFKIRISFLCQFFFHNEIFAFLNSFSRWKTTKQSFRSIKATSKEIIVEFHQENNDTRWRSSIYPLVKCLATIFESRTDPGWFLCYDETPKFLCFAESLKLVIEQTIRWFNLWFHLNFKEIW